MIIERKQLNETWEWRLTKNEDTESPAQFTPHLKEKTELVTNG